MRLARAKAEGALTQDASGPGDEAANVTDYAANRRDEAARLTP
jgi:hypothetical protein